MDDVRIIHGDCLEILPNLEAGSFDAIVTDPPFGVRSETWDNMDDREFARFSMAWLSQARRITPELVVFCTQDSVIEHICRMLYRRVRRMIWAKPIGSQYAGASECGVWFTYEVILHCHDRESWSVVEPRDAEVGRLIRSARERAGMSRGGVDFAIRGKKTGLCYRWEEGACLPTPEQAEKLSVVLGLDGEFREAMERACGSRDRTLKAARAMASEHAARAVDVFTHRTVTGGDHPCQKPVDLIEDILQAVGGDWRNILDPFAGSGSTLEACVNTERSATGIEEDARYVEIARRRIEAARLPMFDRPPSRPEQAGPALASLPGQMSFLPDA